MIISRTPFRMSFAGGGSDLREYYKNGYGAVLSTTINKYIYITANNWFVDKIRVGYSQIEIADNVNQIQHNLVRESMKKTGVQSGTDIVYMSDMLPAHEGFGLGGSSSLVVGTLNALYAYMGKHVSAEKLAREASEIEIDILGAPIGKQDQYAAAYGGFNHIKFHKNEEVTVDPILLKKSTKQELNKNLLLFHTGINSKSSMVLTEQKSKTQNNLEVLDKMVALSEELRDALRNTDLTQFGNMLHKGWEHKQKLASNMTNDLINSYYNQARQAGAIGGKLLGSGGGGFLLFYCEEKNQDNLRNTLSNLREAKFDFDHQGSKIIYVSE